MNDLFGPLEGNGVFVAGCREAVDGGADFAWVGGAQAAQHRARKDAEPDFDLVEPGGMGGGVVKVDLGMAGEPEVVLGFVRVEVVQHDMKLGVREAATRRFMKSRNSTRRRRL